MKSNRSPETNTGASRFPGLLDQCRDIVLVFANAQLAEMFSHTDTALIDFAEKAENNQVQGRFFEAITEIRNQRPDIEHTMRQQITAAFNKMGNWQGAQFGDGAGPGYEVEELTLVDDDDMDESVAIGNMIQRTEANCYAELYALGQRFAILNRGRKMTADELPAGPHPLVYGFQAALRPVQIDTRVKLVLYALFDKFFLKQLPGLYDELNALLTEAGILPNLKPAVNKAGQAAKAGRQEKKHEKSEQDGKADQPRAVPSRALGEELFDNILDLMKANRQRSGRPVREPKHPVPKEELVSVIHHIEPSVGTLFPESDGSDAALISNIEIDLELLERIKRTLAQDREQIFNEIGEENISGADADTIDLVGMLFEYMLNDPVLPNVAKALISHLHTPYLKVAIIDREMLTNSLHPARELLDLLVEAGGLWVDETDTAYGIFPHMQTVVDRVLKDFIDDITLFGELLAWFRGKVEAQRQSTQLIEKRTQEATKGKEKLQVARTRAQQEMKARTGQWPLPGVVTDFLTRTWVDKLIFILLRNPEGEFSDEWNEALRLADEIAWAFDPNATDASRKAFAHSLPKLRSSIEEGLESLGGVARGNIDALFRLLESPAKPWDTVSSEEKKAAVEPPALAAQHRTPSSRFISDETGQADEEAEKPPTPAENELMGRLRALGTGLWFELIPPDSDTRRRIKLSWLSEKTDLCLFVDRAGVQAAVMPLLDLARAILSDNARIIRQPKQPFIERTLVAIRNFLRHPEKTQKDKEPDDTAAT